MRQQQTQAQRIKQNNIEATYTSARQTTVLQY